MNRLIIVGNLTRDPELRTTSSGINVCSFTVAVNKRQKGDTQAADFFRVSAWRQLGENCQKFLAKGRKVAIVGPVSVSTYQANDGSARAQLEITAEDVEFLTRSEQAEQPTQGEEPRVEEPAAPAAASYTEVEDDDLPF